MAERRRDERIRFSVQEGEDGYLQVDIHKPNVYLVRAVQELHLIVKDKEEQVAAQKVQLQSLEARLAALQGAIRSTAAAPPPPDRGGRP